MKSHGFPERPGNENCSHKPGIGSATAWRSTRGVCAFEKSEVRIGQLVFGGMFFIEQQLCIVSCRPNNDFSKEKPRGNTGESI
jgi:hypothetical protein